MRGVAWRAAARLLRGIAISAPPAGQRIRADLEPDVGHIDVLARLGRGGKGLRVYELKAPKADASGALDQAVAYVAALRFVLDQEDDAVKAWWTLIGFSAPPRRKPDFEAFAFVADTPKNVKAVNAAIERLNSANADGIKLDAMYYQWYPRGRLEIKVR